MKIINEASEKTTWKNYVDTHKNGFLSDRAEKIKLDISNNDRISFSNELKSVPIGIKNYTIQASSGTFKFTPHDTAEVTYRSENIIEIYDSKAGYTLKIFF